MDAAEGVAAGAQVVAGAAQAAATVTEPTKPGAQAKNAKSSVLLNGNRAAPGEFSTPR